MGGEELEMEGPRGGGQQELLFIWKKGKKEGSFPLLRCVLRGAVRLVIWGTLGRNDLDSTVKGVHGRACEHIPAHLGGGIKPLSGSSRICHFQQGHGKFSEGLPHVCS